MKRLIAPLISVLLVLVFLSYLCAFTVPYNQVVLVTTWGNVTGTYNGSVDGEAGVHFKAPWPFQSTRSYSTAIHTLQARAIESQTKDSLNVLVGMTVYWRITDPKDFLVALETEKAARRELEDRLMGRQKDVIGAIEFSQLVAGDGTAAAALKNALNKEFVASHGLVVEHVAMRSLQYTAGVSATVNEITRQVQESRAEEYRSRGMADAQRIVSESQTQSSTILAFANKRADEIRSQADLELTNTYKVFQDEPELAVFLRQVDGLEEILGSNTKFILDTRRGSLASLLLHGDEAEDETVDVAEGKTGDEHE